MHPPSFVSEYEQWWTDRNAGRPLGAPWTCLLIIVCACSAQNPTTELNEKLPRDVGHDVKDLAAIYENAARELHSAIPAGHYHFYTLQYLLHSCYWFKTEAQVVESRRVLGIAVGEGCALG